MAKNLGVVTDIKHLYKAIKILDVQSIKKKRKPGILDPELWEKSEKCHIKIIRIASLKTNPGK
ncbi:MAG: hypothetical protein ACE5QV_02160 [Fidelibacterota bacterium]